MRPHHDEPEGHITTGAGSTFRSAPPPASCPAGLIRMETCEWLPVAPASPICPAVASVARRRKPRADWRMQPVSLGYDYRSQNILRESALAFGEGRATESRKRQEIGQVSAQKSPRVHSDHSEVKRPGHFNTQQRTSNAQQPRKRMLVAFRASNATPLKRGGRQGIHVYGIIVVT